MGYSDIFGAGAFIISIIVFLYSRKDKNDGRIKQLEEKQNIIDTDLQLLKVKVDALKIETDKEMKRRDDIRDALVEKMDAYIEKQETKFEQIKNSISEIKEIHLRCQGAALETSQIEDIVKRVVKHIK